MTDDTRGLRDNIIELMNINDGLEPPKFIADPVERNQWIADTVDAAAASPETRKEPVMRIVPPEKPSKADGFTKFAVGFGIAAGLAVVAGVLLWPSERADREEFRPAQEAPRAVATTPSPGTRYEDLDLTVQITDQGFFFDAKSTVKLPWESNGSGDYRVPDIPKKEGDWDYAELGQRLGVLKAAYPEEDFVILEPEANIPYEVVLKVMDSARDESGEPLLAGFGLKHASYVGDTLEWVLIIVVGTPGSNHEQDPAREEALNLVVVMSDEGFHFKTNPLYRMPWMLPSPTDGGPDIPKKNGHYDFVSLQVKLEELKENHPKEKAIVLGAEGQIPYHAFFTMLNTAVHSPTESLFPDVTLTRTELSK